MLRERVVNDLLRLAKFLFFEAFIGLWGFYRIPVLRYSSSATSCFILFLNALFSCFSTIDSSRSLKVDKRYASCSLEMLFRSPEKAMPYSCMILRIISSNVRSCEKRYSFLDKALQLIINLNGTYS